MKTNFFKSLLLLALAIFSFACSDDDESSKHPIEATWILTSNSKTNCTDTNDNSVNTFDCDDQNCTKVTYENGMVIIEITINGDDNNGDTYPYEINGNMITGSDNEMVNFEIVGDQLILTYDSDFNGCTYTITYTKDV